MLSGRGPGPGGFARHGRPPGFAGLVIFWLAAALVLVRTALAQVDLPQPSSLEPIVISAPKANRWTEGSYEVWVFQEGCRIQQGLSFAQGRQAVLWIDRASLLDPGRSKVIAYLEGDVVVDVRQGTARATLSEPSWMGRFYTSAAVQVQAATVEGQPPSPPPVYQHADARLKAAADPQVRPAQFQTPAPATSGGAGPALPPGTRRIRAFPRSDVPVQVQWFPDRQTNQWIAVVTAGVNLVIDGVVVDTDRGPMPLGSIDISTDRLVLWTTGLEEPDLTGAKFQLQETPLELYLEGNIVFRQGDRIIYADRMYYDVRNQVGTVLGAELLTPVPQYEGLLRFRAELMQQLGPNRFFARDAFITSSRMGQPGYRLQVGSAYLEDVTLPRFDPLTGAPLVDPATGQPVLDHQRLATASNGLLFLDDVPVFYWPYIATDLSESSYYIRRIRFRTDNIFGFQTITNWSMYQILGIRRRPAGTDWDLSLDFLSERGFGHGTNFRYDREGFLGLSGHASGMIDYWGINDDGLDTLGRDRRDLEPETHYRYRLLAQHRQMLDNNWQLTVEAGWTSDRNFLEQYFEREWDELKDQSTGVELKKLVDNASWNLAVDLRVNNFFTETQWLPRADHFLLGQSLLNDALTWFEHTSLGFAQFKTPRAPENPAEWPTFRYLPWEVSPSGLPLDTQSERLVTRHEIDWPFQLGPVKVVPYLLGELGHWGEDRSGNDLQRAYGQVGVRASLPVWRVDPTVQSALWNLHGLAHKVVFDAEFALTDVSKNLDQLPLYEPLDDNSIEAFRRRFIPNTFFGPMVPPQFDERAYAVRTGMAGWVTAPSMEIAEDLLAFRLGMRNRWQTKRGGPLFERIVDWITLDTNLVLFPKPDRDNFGEVLGLVDYDLRWQVGDRLALLSAGAFDFFHDGQRVVTVGGFLDRPPRGGLYLGLRILEGPIDNLILAMSYSYRMSPKWVSSFGMTVDLRDQGNIGQNFSLTRVGESFLVSAGFNVDAGRDSVGAHLSIEPRFLPKTRLGQAGGARIPIAGSTGLE